MFTMSEQPYSDIETLLKLKADTYETVNKIEYKDKKRRVYKYVNLPLSFDIETSSFYISNTGKTYTNQDIYEKTSIIKSKNSTKEQKKEATDFLCTVKKQAIMYCWQIGINGGAVIGRTWEEWKDAIKAIEQHFELNGERRAIIYVHNLAYEMQWIRKRLEWAEIFAREKRAPMKALTKHGIEFRCSYMLSGMSLEKTLENLTKYKIEKKVGDLDYNQIRNKLTPLNNEEQGYCVNDVVGVNAYIQEQIEQYGNIVNIPLTNTGRVRLKCRDNCFNKKNGKRYRELMKELRITSLDEYKALKRAFQGGFTHASVKKAGKVYYNVKSWDFTSSYPTVLVADLYPMSKATFVKSLTIDEMEELMKTRLLVFDVYFKNIEEAVTYEHPISESKCWDKLGVTNDNGRVLGAKRIRTTITSIDWKIYKEMYTWDDCEISNIYSYAKGYLPTPFVETILNLYEDKTTLKDVEGKEAEYQNSKGMLNSTYGCTVTDIITDLIEYEEDEWKSEPGNQEKQLEKYNMSSKRFLFYPWGVFCTAYARRNLFYGINEFKDDYIYSDTDSVKVLNYKDHMDFIEKYNEWIIGKLTNACNYHKISVDKIKPKTIEGKEKPLGVWDDDGNYDRFKTLGAKRYLVEYTQWKDKEGNPLETPEKHLKCTIAGVNKKKTSKWFEKDYQKAFDIFNDDMTVPAESSGRLIVGYLDDETEGNVTDYLGNTCYYNELSSAHMEMSDYNLSMSDTYMMLLQAVGDEGFGYGA